MRLVRVRFMSMIVTLGVTLGASLVSGCGPIVYVNEVTRRASTSVDQARAAEADKYAPYWWTRATQYLHQARVLAAHSDFQGSNRFGRLAADAADKATEEAELAAKDPSRRPIADRPAPAKQDVAPAKDAVAPAKDAP